MHGKQMSSSFFPTTCPGEAPARGRAQPSSTEQQLGEAATASWCWCQGCGTGDWKHWKRWKRAPRGVLLGSPARASLLRQPWEEGAASG